MDIVSSQSKTFDHVNTGMSHNYKSYSNIIENDADDSNTLKTSLNIKTERKKGMRIYDLKAKEL